ncbi:MAG TPA: TIGR02217 family protein, partial [Croceibacterium sp.]|nr:TIGR02217 family protein [Croceibacterium sp.]
MAFWLARKREGQDSDYIQRFDPRFWTVNFPRPMIATVVTTGTDSLRVEAEFHHTGELAGLIWDSADAVSHPLLAYSTDRDYSRTTLRFRWRSGGVLPLDAVHGPTLTIEGRDAAGVARSWYVRLWNYAQGSPEDAQIVLPFSELRDGWEGAGDAVHPADIDRMFLSLAPPGYEPEGEELLP